MSLLSCLLFVAIIIRSSYQYKPNILFLILDDLRPNLGAYNYPSAHTPNLDKLAEISFVFKNAFAQQALCAPSRNSFLTSRRPDSLQLYDFYSYWRDTVGNFTTLPQHFKEHGYFTHSIGKVFHPGASSNYTDDARYSWSSIPYHPSTEQYKEAKVCLNDNGIRARNLMCPVRIIEQPQATLPDLQSLDAAIEFLHARDMKAVNNSLLPFFLAVGFHKPHIPFKYPQEYLRFHPLDKIELPAYSNRPPGLPTVAWNPWTDLRDRDDIASLNLPVPFGPMPANTSKQIIQNYNAAVSYVDDLIGQLLRKIDKNTIVVLVGDHGWSMGEHGEFSKYSNFDVATRVPLIIHVPMLSTKKILIENIVELVDLFPTLVDLASVTKPLVKCKPNIETILCTEGKSLVPLMASRASNNALQDVKYENVAINQYPRPGSFPTLKPNSDKPRLKDIKIMGYSLRTDRYRYTEWVEFDNKRFKGNWSQSFAKELYDHYLDPEENMNLAHRKELNAIMKMLRKKLILALL